MGPSPVHPVHASFGSSQMGLGDLSGCGTADSGGPNAATACDTNKLEVTFRAGRARSSCKLLDLYYS